MGGKMKKAAKKGKGKKKRIREEGFSLESFINAYNHEFTLTQNQIEEQPWLVCGDHLVLEPVECLSCRGAKCKDCKECSKCQKETEAISLHPVLFDRLYEIKVKCQSCL